MEAVAGVVDSDSDGDVVFMLFGLVCGLSRLSGLLENERRAMKSNIADLLVCPFLLVLLSHPSIVFPFIFESTRFSSDFEGCAIYTMMTRIIKVSDHKDFVHVSTA